MLTSNIVRNIKHFLAAKTSPTVSGHRLDSLAIGPYEQRNVRICSVESNLRRNSRYFRDGNQAIVMDRCF
jgi:hypothetical protein